jgi:hypothetical protein
MEDNIKEVTTKRGNRYRVDPHWKVLVLWCPRRKYWQTVQNVPIDELDDIKTLHEEAQS